LPCSTLEEAAHDFELPKMVQATFYAMLLNDAVELGIVNRFMAIDLKATLEGLRWTSFESWLKANRRGLLEPSFASGLPSGVLMG